IDLGGQIVQPALLCPEKWIGVQVLISGLSGLGVGPPGIGVPVLPYPEGADAELYPGLLFLDRGMYPFDQGIHIAAPPIPQTLAGKAVSGKGAGIVKAFPF